MRALAVTIALLLAQDTLIPGAKDRTHPALTKAAQGEWKGPFFFIQLADPQFGFMDAEQEAKNAGRAVEHVNRLKPKFAIVCGDLVHPPPGAKGRDEKLVEFKRIFSNVDPSIPLVCVSGNHDVGNKPTPASLREHRALFGDDWFTFWAGGVRCLVLDSTLFSDPSGAPDEQKAQAEWFAKELAGEKAKHLLVFQHHPWFLVAPDEKDAYMNIPLERRRPALEAMKAAGVRAVFAGHLHANAHGMDGTLEMVTTGPVGKPLKKDPSGLRIVEVREDGLKHRYYALDEVPEKVDLR